MLQLYYESIENKDLVLITESDMAPIIMNNSGISSTVFLLKNISNKILCNIEISAGSIPVEYNLKSAITDIYTIVTDADLADGIEYDKTIEPILTELYPGETVKMTIKTNSGTNIGIDFNSFSLDIGYIYSDISISNILAYYLFKESKGSLVAASSVGVVNATVSNSDIIKGNGIAYFQNDTDSISFSITSSNNLSLFLRGIFDEKSNNVIFTNGNMTFGMNADRKLYVTIGGSTVVSDYSLVDYNQEYIIGISVSSTKDLLITVNGEATDLLDQPSTPVLLSGSSSCSIGPNLSAEIETLALYSEYKSLAFHNEFFIRIS